jgi:hypothetical protein
MIWLSLPRWMMWCGWSGRTRRGWRAMVAGNESFDWDYIIVAQEKAQRRNLSPFSLRCSFLMRRSVPD